MVRYCLLCKWSTDIDIKGKRSLHRFPTDEAQRKNWLKIIGKTNIKLSKHLNLCSSHFEESCFHNAVGCFKTLKPNSVPTKYITEKPPDEEDPPVTKTKFLSIQWASHESQPSCTIIENIADDELESPALIQVCRVCLAFDVKMYHIGECDLYEYYENVTGIVISFDDTLPKMLCWECAASLKKANNFREKALRSFNLLMSKVKSDTYISLRDVKSIDRVEHNLQSPLVVEHFDRDDNFLSINIPKSVPDEDDGVEMVCDYNDDTEDANDNIENIPEEVLEIQQSDLFEEYLDDFNDEIEEPSEDHTSTIKSIRSKRLGGLKKWGDLDESQFTVRQLSAAEQLAELAQRRESAAYRAARYRCDVCYRVFVTQAKQERHALKHSDSRGQLECNICKNRYRLSRLLRSHMASSHTKSYTCKLCSFFTKSSFVAKKHQQFHAGMTFKCPHCPLEFVRTTKYFNHIRRQHVSFICEYCGQTFVNQKGVDAHRAKSHRSGDFEAELAGPHCAKCDVRFATDEAHDRHLRQSAAHRHDDFVVSKRRRHYFPRRPRSRNPLNRDHQKTFKVVHCEQCGADCENLRAYAHHFREHHPGCNRTQYGGSEPVMCEHCGKIYQDKGKLKFHMVEHTGGEFKCDVCGKNFAHYSTFYYHRRQHQPNAGFDCPLCGKRFTAHCNRQRHIKYVHGGLKRFKCETCDKWFRDRTTLQSHIDHVHHNVPWPKRVRVRRPRPALGASSVSHASDDVAVTVEI